MDATREDLVRVIFLRWPALPFLWTDKPTDEDWTRGGIVSVLTMDPDLDPLARCKAEGERLADEAVDGCDGPARHMSRPWFQTHVRLEKNVVMTTAEWDSSLPARLAAT